MNEDKDLRKMLSFIKNTIKDKIKILRKRYNYQVIEDNKTRIKLKCNLIQNITIYKLKEHNIYINMTKFITIEEINIIQCLKKLYEEEIHIQEILRNGTGTNGTKK